jgi:hypothetical protein
MYRNKHNLWPADLARLSLSELLFGIQSGASLSDVSPRNHSLCRRASPLWNLRLVLITTICVGFIIIIK